MSEETEPTQDQGSTRLTGEQIAAARLDGWANLLGGLQTRIATPDFATALALVDAIGAAAQQQGHHPDLRLQTGLVDVRLSSADVRGVTERDVTLARTCSALAADAGLTPSSDGLTRVELALDSPAYRDVLPFWGAVLGLADQAAYGVDDELRDATDAGPVVWFQPSGDEEPRQRWHPDVWVEPSQVQPRIDAALAAGGTLVSDAEAPAFWVLADPDGNRACLCTWQERS